MSIYTVHVPRAVTDPIRRAERTAFVRDGFNAWAFLFGPFFLFRHRAWLAGVIWLVLVAVGLTVANLLHVPGGMQAALMLLLQLFVGLEGSSLRRAALDRRGFEFADVVAGQGRDESEIRFFRHHLAAHADEAAPRPHPQGWAAATAAQKPYRGEAVIGMFPGQGAEP